MKKCTFQPNLINVDSSWDRKVQKRRAVSAIEGGNVIMPRPLHEQLQKHGRDKEEKLRKAREEKAKKEKKSLKFKPKINENSRHMVENRIT